MINRHVLTLTLAYYFSYRLVVTLRCKISVDDAGSEGKKKKGKKAKKLTDEERMKKKRALLLGGDSDVEDTTETPVEEPVQLVQ